MDVINMDSIGWGQSARSDAGYINSLSQQVIGASNIWLDNANERWDNGEKLGSAETMSFTIILPVQDAQSKKVTQVYAVADSRGTIYEVQPKYNKEVHGFDRGSWQNTFDDTFEKVIVIPNTQFVFVATGHNTFNGQHIADIVKSIPLSPSASVDDISEKLNGSIAEDAYKNSKQIYYTIVGYNNSGEYQCLRTQFPLGGNSPLHYNEKDDMRLFLSGISIGSNIMQPLSYPYIVQYAQSYPNFEDGIVSFLCNCLYGIMFFSKFITDSSQNSTVGGSIDIVKLAPSEAPQRLKPIDHFALEI